MITTVQRPGLFRLLPLVPWLCLAGCSAGGEGSGGKSVVDSTAPRPVPIVTAAAGAGGSATVTWTASPDAAPSGASDVASYEVTWLPADAGTQPVSVTPAAVGTAPPTTITVNGLSATSDYTFSVTAIDFAGNRSTATAAAQTVRPGSGTASTTPPADVTNFVVASNGFIGQLQLTWTPPQSTTGIVRYEITYAPAGLEFQPKIVMPATATGTTVTGLSNASAYVFTVKSVDSSNNKSTGVSNAAAVSPTGTQADITAPQNVTGLAAAATGTPGEVQLTWIPSTSADVMRYDITWPQAGGPAQPVTIVDPATTGARIAGLGVCTTYTFTVTTFDTSSNPSQGPPAVTVSPGDASLFVESIPSGGVFPKRQDVIFNTSVAGGVTVTWSINGADPDCGGPNVWTPGVSGPIPVDPAAPPVGSGTNFMRLKYRLVTATGPSTIRTEIYEIFPSGGPPAQRFVKFSGMRRARLGHTATRLSTSATNPNDVIVVGGRDRSVGGVVGTLANDAERFNADFEHFEAVASVMPTARWWHASSVISGGRILVCGGQLASLTNGAGSAFNPYTPATSLFAAPGTSNLTNDAFIYDGATNTFAATAGTMASPRFFHTATRLFTDQVLVAGGLSGTVILGTPPGAPLFCVSTTPAKTTISLPVGTNLAGVNKGDLVEVNGGQIGVVTLASEGDPTVAGSTDLLNVEGMIVDVRGGAPGDAIRVMDGRGVAGAGSGELFTPAAGTFANTTGTMVLRRFGHAATLLDDGTVLLSGGSNDLDSVTIGDLIPEIFDRTVGANGSFRFAGVGDSARMAVNRFFHTATKLKDGKVLIAGGIDNGFSVFEATGFKGTIQSSADLYDPVTETTKPVGSMSSPRCLHSATLLEDGRVLIVGGVIAFNTTTGDFIIGQTADVYDPVTQKFTSLIANDFRAHNTSVTLSDGRGLIMGGAAAGTGAASDLAELFLPANNQFTATAHGIAGERTFGAASAVLSDGRSILVAGGQTDVRAGSTQLVAGPVLATAELYSLSSIKSSFTSNAMSVGRRFHTATLMLDRTTAGVVKGSWHGKVLITGGENETGGTNLAELYDPATNRFSATGPMNGSRWNHTATLLKDGRVLVTGGGDTGSPLGSAEVYVPATGSWVNTANNMFKARTKHTATLLTDGRVLVAGGNDVFDKTAELYDPNTNSFLVLPVGGAALADVMSAGRRGHGATLRTYSAGFALFTNGSATVRGFQTGWLTAPAASAPAAGDFIASLKDGTLYTIAAPGPGAGVGAPDDAGLTLTSSFAGPSTVGYQPYVILKNIAFLAGGESGSSATDTFTGGTSAFAPSAAVSKGRHALTVIATADGKVLVAGGLGGETDGEVFDPATGVFSAPFLFDAGAPFSFHTDARGGNGIVLFFRSHSAQAFFRE